MNKVDAKVVCIIGLQARGETVESMHDLEVVSEDVLVLEAPHELEYVRERVAVVRPACVGRHRGWLTYNYIFRSVVVDLDRVAHDRRLMAMDLGQLGHQWSRGRWVY